MNCRRNLKAGAMPWATLAGIGIVLAGCAATEGTDGTDGISYDRAGTREQVLAASARQRALDSLASGETLEWRSPDGSAVGRITPTRSFRADTGSFCREFEEEVDLGAGTDRFTDIRCRTDGGRWLRPSE